tara:strand:- start:200 stop:697 length:498 start_codon:yes stop_codon:yes gene_type:complete
MHKNPLKNMKDYNPKKIILSDNLFVMYLYRQSLDKTLPFYDASAQGPPPIWNEFEKVRYHLEYTGNWRDHQVKGYGWCFYFYTNNEVCVLQWDLFYPKGAHIHYESNGELMKPSCGVEGDPLDWAFKTLGDQKLLDKQFEINVNVNDMIPLRESIVGLKRGIITN